MVIEMNNNTLTLSDIIDVLGEPTKRQGGEMLFACPICRSYGNDSHSDNLRYNPNKGILWCFAGGENHSTEVLKMINAKKKDREYKPMTYETKPTTQVNPIPQWELNREEYLQYMVMAQEELFKRPDLLDFIYKKRGLRKETIELVGVGFDPTENTWLLPIFSLKYDCIIDFELREHGEKKKIRRLGGGCSTIAEIYGKRKAKTLYILEGFWKSYALVQYLLDKGITDFAVYSCSHGVNSLFSCMNEINFSNFDEIKLMLDADEAGDDVTKQIINSFPFIKDARKFLYNSGHKDFDEWYVKEVLKIESKTEIADNFPF